MSGIAGMPEFAGQAKVPDDEAGEHDRVVRAIVLGILSGLAGAAVWVAFGAATKHEIGFVAVGVGILVGWSMARVRAAWSGLPFVAAAIALVAVLLGDVVLDVYLQADYEQIGFGEALGTTLTTPSLARELFSAYFSPIDALFWVIATTSAYRFVSASVLAVRGRREADAGPPARLYGPHA
jgi:hypothetical protein